MDRQFKKITLSFTVSCLFFEFGYGLTPCQNGYSYKHECDPYYNINLIQAKVGNQKDNISRRVANSIKPITKNITYAKATHTTHKQENLTYLDTLRQKYSNQFNGNMGLQALIDRSKYLSLKVVEENATTNKATQPKKELIVKKEEVKKSIATTKKQEETKVAKKEKAKKTTKIAKNEHKNSVAKKKQVEKYITYVVKKGDNLTKIAKKYALKKADILRLNKLDKNATIKIGQKLKLSSKVKLAKIEKSKQKVSKKKQEKNFYVVKKGDTLSAIAKKLNISIVKLREINRLSRSSKIKVGQKLALKPKKASGFTIQKYDIVKNTKFRKVPSFKFKRKIRVVATAYTSHRNQTDKTPFLAAWNNRLKPGMKIIAVSPDLIKKYGLTNGVKVKILGLPGYYVVRDKMNARLRNHIDIYMGVNKRKALQWGRRRIVLYW